jgi:putative ABC transport system permease protein
VLGGAFGLLLAQLCLRTLVLAGPTDLPRLSKAGLDVHVLLFAAAVSVAVVLLAGLTPVVQMRHLDLTIALKEGSPQSGGGRRVHFFRNALVIAEIAITLVLSFASGLLLRSLIAAQTSYPGFDPNRLLALELMLPESRYHSDEMARQFYDRLMREVRSEPGVEAAGAVNSPPSGGDRGDWWYSIIDQPAPPRDDVPIALFNSADPAYFRTMHMRLLAGRSFSDADRAGGPRIAIINEEVARKWWKLPQLALGHQIKLGGPYMEGPTLEIIGVVGNVSQMGLDTAPFPEIYFAFAQRASRGMVVMIRTLGEPPRMISAIRQHVASIDPNVPIQSLRPFEKWLGASLERRRFSTVLLGIFAALAMILAAVGIYGVLNYWVSVRQKEIAIRLALGAQRSAILRWAGSHAGRLVMFGMVLGAFGAWAASRWLRSMLFGVSAQDPAMMFSAAGAVIAIAALAAAVPMWRAVRVDAVPNLRDV